MLLEIPRHPLSEKRKGADSFKLRPESRTQQLVPVAQGELEDKLHPELDVARIAHRCHLTKGAGRSRDVNGSEVRVIENIESLATELQARALAKANVLEQ